MAKQHDHGFEMMAIVAIVAVVGLVIMFMNTGGDLVGEASKLYTKDTTFSTAPKLGPDRNLWHNCEGGGGGRICECDDAECNQAAQAAKCELIMTNC